MGLYVGTLHAATCLTPTRWDFLQQAPSSGSLESLDPML